MSAVNNSMKYPPRRVHLSHTLAAFARYQGKWLQPQGCCGGHDFQMADQSATSKFMKSSLEQFIKAARFTGCLVLQRIGSTGQFSHAHSLCLWRIYDSNQRSARTMLKVGMGTC